MLFKHRKCHNVTAKFKLQKVLLVTHTLYIIHSPYASTDGNERKIEMTTFLKFQNLYKTVFPFLFLIEGSSVNAGTDAYFHSTAP